MEARRRTIDCSSKPFCTDIEPGFRRDLPERFGGIEDRPSAFRPVGKERRFRAHFQDVGERSRQRIHDDRRHHRALTSTARGAENGEQRLAGPAAD